MDVIKNHRESFDIAKLGDLVEFNPSAPNDVDEAKPPIPETSPITTATAPQISHSSTVQSETPLSRAAPMSQELPILVDHGQVARIPFPMSEEAFDLLIGTLNL